MNNLKRSMCLFVLHSVSDRHKKKIGSSRGVPSPSRMRRRPSPGFRLALALLTGACGGGDDTIQGSLPSDGCADSPKTDEGLIVGGVDALPQLADRTGALRAIAHSIALEAPEASGTARVWFTIDTTGQVIDARIASSSGHKKVDSVAVHSARSFRFYPAQSSNRPVCYSISLPVQVDVQRGG